MQADMMAVADILGWVAVIFTLAAFSVRTMLPLRVAAIGANLFFMGYAYLEGMFPIFALHAILLPFNVVRLGKLVRDKRISEQGGEVGLQDLCSFDVSAQSPDPDRDMTETGRPMPVFPSLRRRSEIRELTLG